MTIGTILSTGIPKPRVSVVAHSSACSGSTWPIRRSVSADSTSPARRASFSQVPPALRPVFSRIASQSAGSTDGANCSVACRTPWAR
ncbi:hypothetical protein [Kribbella sp. ALI-6-A]|uniref:hypothetical protein n=1 Tax=Kribbella sp. ALI-6-A TaxID=1933817 RepID=UPI001EDC4B83|nr:hypothetical protein [Kribbella sp. ALI-6-A]